MVIAAVLAIVERGPGPVSLDRAFGIEHSGRTWMVAALLAGLTGPTLAAMLLAQTTAEPETGTEDSHG